MGHFKACTSARALVAQKDHKIASGPASDTHSFPFSKEAPKTPVVLKVTDYKMLFCPRLESLQHFFLLVAALLSKWNELKIYGNLR